MDKNIAIVGGRGVGKTLLKQLELLEENDKLKEENKRLKQELENSVRFPCKVGDTVLSICNFKNHMI